MWKGADGGGERSVRTFPVSWIRERREGQSVRNRHRDDGARDLRHSARIRRKNVNILGRGWPGAGRMIADGCSDVCISVGYLRRMAVGKSGCFCRDVCLW